MEAAVQKTDEEIARSVQAGATEDFGLLITRYEGRLKRYGRRFLGGSSDVEDIVQEVFLKAYRNFQSFDPRQKFSSWIYRIAHNEFINALRKRGRTLLTYFDPDVIFPHPISSERAESETEIKHLRQMLEKGLGGLPQKYRELLILYYFEEMDYREIADVLRLPVSTVGVRLKRGREALKGIFDKLGYTL